MSSRLGWLPRALTTAALVSAVAAPAVPAAAAAAPPAGCTAISEGATGSAVKVVQKAIGAKPDGGFGPHTKAALLKWQQAHEVPTTGVVDAATWDSFPHGVAVKACGRRLAGSGFKSTCAVLRPGVDAIAVVVLQRKLGVTPDGQFGAVTEQALRTAQSNAHLPATGVTDKSTWKALHLWRTPVCVHGGGAAAPKDAKAQARVQARTDAMARALATRPGTTRNKLVLQAEAFARRQIGKPYRYGGTGPKSYDCSGLTMTAYLHAGLTIPRVAADQYASGGRQVPLDHAREGDLLFYASDLTKPATIHHVVMYVGHDTVLHAPYTGTTIQTQRLWTSGLLPVAVRPTAHLSLPLGPGATGYGVAQLQMALNRHHAALSVDGGFGPSTASAVRSWQAKRHLKATGVVHVKTWLTLG